MKKELPNSNVTITDISEKALKIAKKNIENLDIRIIKTNMLKQMLKENIKYDVVISNPPYISKKDKVMDIVRKKEPKKALYAKNDGLYYYGTIIKDIKQIISKEYIIAFEIGDKQDKAIKQMIKKQLKDSKIIVKKDYKNRNRMIFKLNK